MSLKIEVWDLPEPLLEFGESRVFSDPRIGLVEEGPFSLRFGVAHQRQVRLGLVGPASVIGAARFWFERCQRPIPSSADNPIMYPDYPGFEAAFHASLDLDSRWLVEIDPIELERSLALNERERFQRVLDLYTDGIRRLVDDEIRPDVVVCCLSEEVVRNCWSVSSPDLTSQQRRAIRRQQQAAKIGQLFLPFGDEWDIDESPDDLLNRDFRRALKAGAMALRMPTQIGTLRLFADDMANQDPATRAWNVAVALFYKAGGIPWRLKYDGPETCFAGISFHHLRTPQRHLVYSSLAQAFSSQGDGFALRGSAVPWDPNQGRVTKLTGDQAASLAHQILTEYRDRTGHDPSRMVLHKTSLFDKAERDGVLSTLRHIPVVELVTLQPTEFRLVLRGAYPPRRGTFCQVNEDASYLFTTGYVPEWETYPGPHIPAPIRIITDRSVDARQVAADVLGLTRMSWNTARNTGGVPITLRFARAVGGIMAEVGLADDPNPSYRYYM